MLSNELIERLLGYSLSPKEHTETIKRREFGFELKHNPFISLISVQARTDEWGYQGVSLGQSVWVDIPTEHIHLYNRSSVKYLVLPPTLFGTEYSEVRVTYKAGLSTIPESLQKALETVEHLVDTGEINAWNCLLPNNVLEVIDSFRKEDK